MGRIPEVTLGWRLRIAAGEMQHEEIAEELGVHRSTVSRWLSDRGVPKRAFLMQWALMTGVDYTWLATGSPATPSPSTTQPRDPVDHGAGEEAPPVGLEPTTCRVTPLAWALPRAA